MKQTVKHYFAISLILLFGFSQQSFAVGQNEKVKAILEETGFDKLLEHIPDFAQNILKQSSGALEPQVSSAMSQAFNHAFAARAVSRDVYTVINTHQNSENIDAFLKQLQSPLAKKVAELESSTSNPESREDMIAFAEALKTTPPSAKREQLITRLDKATRVTEFGVDLQAAFFKAVFTAVNPVLDSDMQVGTKEMEKMVGEIRLQFEEAYRTNTRLTYLYALRSFTDKELDDYITLCESDEYRWGVQMLGNAMISALNQAADRAANLMAKASQ